MVDLWIKVLPWRPIEPRRFECGPIVYSAELQTEQCAKSDDRGDAPLNDINMKPSQLDHVADHITTPESNGHNLDVESGTHAVSSDTASHQTTNESDCHLIQSHHPPLFDQSKAQNSSDDVAGSAESKDILPMQPSKRKKTRHTLRTITNDQDGANADGRDESASAVEVEHLTVTKPLGSTSIHCSPADLIPEESPAQRSWSESGDVGHNHIKKKKLFETSADAHNEKNSQNEWPSIVGTNPSKALSANKRVVFRPLRVISNKRTPSGEPRNNDATRYTKEIDDADMSVDEPPTPMRSTALEKQQLPCEHRIFGNSDANDTSALTTEDGSFFGYGASAETCSPLTSAAVLKDTVADGEDMVAKTPGHCEVSTNNNGDETCIGAASGEARMVRLASSEVGATKTSVEYVDAMETSPDNAQSKTESPSTKLGNFQGFRTLRGDIVEPSKESQAIADRLFSESAEEHAKPSIIAGRPGRAHRAMELRKKKVEGTTKSSSIASVSRRSRSRTSSVLAIERRQSLARKQAGFARMQGSGSVEKARAFQSRRSHGPKSLQPSPAVGDGADVSLITPRPGGAPRSASSCSSATAGLLQKHQLIASAPSKPFVPPATEKNSTPRVGGHRPLSVTCPPSLRTTNLQRDCIINESNGACNPPCTIRTPCRGNAASAYQYPLQSQLPRLDTLSTQELRSCGLCDVVLRITASNAHRVRFDAASGKPFDIEGEGALAPVCISALSVDYTALHLINTRKLDPALVRKTKEGRYDDLAWLAWVRNHYRWIVWKLASIERTWRGERGHLTYDAVAEQLAHRFNREIKCAQKPALRAILQRDAPSERLVVLCVSLIESSGTTSSLELTDGWYSVRAELDGVLSYRVSKGAIRVGTKLAICGARLDGNAVDPVEVLMANERAVPPDSLPSNPQRLYLHGNGTRLARWNARLGFHRIKFMATPLHAVIVGQGPVPSFDAVVSRIILPAEADDVPIPCPDEDELVRENDDGHKPSTSPVRNEQQANFLAIRLASQGKRNQHPVFAELILRTLDIIQGDDALREGDLVRVMSCDAWRTRIDGTLALRFGKRSRVIRRESPAPRSVAASAWYEPRSLVRCSRAAALLRENQWHQSTVDIGGIVVDVINDVLFIADASPYLISVSLQATDAALDARRARSLKSGHAVALLNVIVARFVEWDIVCCECSKDFRVCSTASRLDDVSRASTSRA